MGLWGNGRAGSAVADALNRGACIIYFLNFCASFGYHMLSVLLVIYATHEFGMNDVEAGVLYGWWGIISSLWAGVISFVIDVAGVKRLAIAGSLLLGILRALTGLARSASSLRFWLLALTPLAEGLLAPVYMVGIKLVTREESRPFAYSFNYAMHNAGGGVTDVFIDMLRAWYRRDPAGFARTFGDSLTVSRVCILSSAPLLLLSALSACALPAALCPPLRRKQYSEFHDEDGALAPAPRSLRETVGGILVLASDRRLWFVALAALCLVFPKMQWHHMNATMPKYLIRELGDEVPWGSVNSINYWMCAVLPPLVAAGTSNWRPFRAIVIGSFVMAVAPVFMVFKASVLAACAWLVVMSCGEVVWSPRFNALSANLSPPGKEGAFFVLAYTPQFFASLPTGWLSGFLLGRYCPDCPDCRDPVSGSFCSRDCRAPGAPSACGAAARAAVGPSCASRAGSGKCLARDWGPLLAGAGGAAAAPCPTTCHDCPGWRESADGPALWLWVLVLSVLGPLLLLGVRCLLPPELEGEPKGVSNDEEAREVQLGEIEAVVVGASSEAG